MILENMYFIVCNHQYFINNKKKRGKGAALNRSFTENSITVTNL